VTTGDSSATQVKPQPILRPVEELPTPKPTYRTEERPPIILNETENRRFVEGRTPEDSHQLGPNTDQILSVRENTPPAVPEEPFTIIKTVQAVYNTDENPSKLVSPREKRPLVVPPRVPKESASFVKRTQEKDSLPLETEPDIDTKEILTAVDKLIASKSPESINAEIASRNAATARENAELNNLKKEASPSSWKAKFIKAAVLSLIAAVAIRLTDDNAITPTAEQQFKDPNADVATKIIKLPTENELVREVTPEAAVAPPIETELISHEVKSGQSISSILAIYNPDKYLDPKGKFRYDDKSQAELYTGIAQVLSDNRAQLEPKNPELYKLIDEAAANGPIDPLQLKKLVQQTGGQEKVVRTDSGDIININKTTTTENNSQPVVNESENEQIVQPDKIPQSENQKTSTPPTTLHTPPPTPTS